MMLPVLVLSLACLDAKPSVYGAEAARLTTAMIQTFYDSKNKIWKPLVTSSESVGRQGYTFWSSLLAWQAIIEAAKVDAKRWKPDVDKYFDTLEQYFDKHGHAYCAWTYFPGNDDQFYDDNTWAVIACMEAYAITGEARFKARGAEIFNGFVRGGWDNSDNPGGLRWGTKAGLQDRSDRTVSATAAGALAALLLAPIGDRAGYEAWAKRALDWIRTKLSADNGLIYDGFRAPNFSRMPTIWTYNTGVPIRAALEYARQTKDESYRKWAIAMGDACLDRTQSPMFDGSVADLSKRYWYDSTFFIHYLVDGMRELTRATGDQKYANEARREANFVKTYLYDEDGLYLRNMRLWMIDAKRLAAYQKLTGQSTPAFSPDASERSMEPADMTKPVGQRPIVKTLLANAGTARMFWLLSH